jgi:hypothetical protein
MGKIPKEAAVMTPNLSQRETINFKQETHFKT